MTQELEQLLSELQKQYNISDEDMGVLSQAIDTTIAEAVSGGENEGYGEGEEQGYEDAQADAYAAQGEEA